MPLKTLLIAVLFFAFVLCIRCHVRSLSCGVDGGCGPGVDGEIHVVWSRLGDRSVDLRGQVIELLLARTAVPLVKEFL